MTASMHVTENIGEKPADKPFTGDTILSIQYKTVNTDPVPPCKLNPAIPRDLEAVILQSS